MLLIHFSQRRWKNDKAQKLLEVPITHGGIVAMKFVINQKDLKNRPRFQNFQGNTAIPNVISVKCSKK